MHSEAEPFGRETREYFKLVQLGVPEPKSLILRHGALRVRRARKYAQRHARHNVAGYLCDLLNKPGAGAAAAPRAGRRRGRRSPASRPTSRRTTKGGVR